MPIVSLIGSDKRFECHLDETLLKAASRNLMKEVKSGCENGGCGVCRVKIESGNWTLTGPMSRARVSKEDQEKGWGLACRIKPLSDLIISVD